MSTARAYATVTGPTAIFTSPDGRTETVDAADVDDIRLAVVRRAADEARRTGEPVELITSGDRGEHCLLVSSDGAVTTVPRPPAPPLPPSVDSGSRDERPPLRASVRETGTSAETESRTPALSDSVASEASNPGTPEVRRRTSFIPDSPGDVGQATGWRGLFRRLGVTIQPSPREQRRATDIAIASRQWAGCRMIAVVNGKGGVGKTMTTAMLAAAYARHGGGNVLAWDNNDTRGTLGWRTESGLYDTTIRDLLPDATELLAPTASVSDITRYVHHQAADRYDVLRSNPELLAADQRINQGEFDVLAQVGARYYRLVVFDSGNDESADRWIRMVDGAHQLVVPTLAVPESAESAALLLDALRNRDERSAKLAAGAVVVVTQSEPSALAETRRIAEGFEGQVAAVEMIPFDASLKSGPLRFDKLRPATRDAWLRVAAAAASEL